MTRWALVSQRSTGGFGFHPSMIRSYSCPCQMAKWKPSVHTPSHSLNHPTTLIPITTHAHTNGRRINVRGGWKKNWHKCCWDDKSPALFLDEMIPPSLDKHFHLSITVQDIILTSMTLEAVHLWTCASTRPNLSRLSACILLHGANVEKKDWVISMKHQWR